MRWASGKIAREERRQAKIESRKQKYSRRWYRWFAWVPVCIDEKQWVWLETVERIDKFTDNGFLYLSYYRTPEVPWWDSGTGGNN